MHSRKRVLIIGLDGFTWQVGKRLISDGIMPCLGKLVENGCHGDLKSVMPFETAPAWSSFQTGCLPGKTGIFAFHTYNRDTKKVRLNCFEDIAMPTIWELASLAGKVVVSLNMPVSSPPPKVNGVIIPGLLCPKLSKRYVHPPEAFDKYIKPNKDYLIVNNDHRETIRETVEQSIVTEKARCRTALELMKDIDWDIFCVQLQSSDLMQHRVWHAIEPTAKGYNEPEHREILKFYKECDKIIEKIIKAAGNNAATFVVSDHGFGNLNYSVSTNVWLKQNGYLELMPKEPDSQWTTIKKKNPPLKALARLYGNIRKKLRKKGTTEPFSHIELLHMRHFIDFEKTIAFCLGAMGGMLYINASDDQKTRIAEKITAELLRDLGPNSDIPIISKITTGMDEYGKNSKTIPDLVLEFDQGITSKINPTGDTVINSELKDGKQMGTHTRNGIFVAQGQNIRSNEDIDAKLIDITPTVLAYLGIPVPSNLDGKVLNSIFKEPLNINYQDIQFDRKKTIQYTNNEQAEVEKHLTDLGYL